MKRISLFASAILVAGSLSFLSSCNNAPKSQEAEVVDSVAVVPEEPKGATELAVDTTTSKVAWIGSTPVKNHNGTFGIAPDSKLVVENGTLTGGTITIDMNNIKVLDITAAADNAKLVGHLKSKDFFAADVYPTSVFTITSVEVISADTVKTVEGAYTTENPTHKITGNLKMMDVEKSISFYANVTMPAEGEVNAKAKFNLDRTQFNVSFMAEGTGKVKDKLINNNVNIELDITAKAAPAM